MKRRILVLTLSMLLITFTAIVAFAATDVYDLICTRSSDGQSLRLYTTTMKYNQDNLSTTHMWAGKGDDAAKNWDYWGSPLTDDEVSYSNADIIFRDGQTLYASAPAQCRKFDEDGNQFSSDTSTWASFGYDFEIHYAIITADTDENWKLLLGSADRVSILTHEVGHAIGLGHPTSSSTDSIMQAESDNPGASSTVTSGDKDAIEELY